MRKHYRSILTLLENCRTMVELKQIHGLMIKSAVINEVIPLSRLVDFCTNPETENLNYARSVFESIDHPSVYIWNSMIRGYSNSLTPDIALIFYEEMLRKDYSPDHFTFPFVLQACSGIRNVDFGKCVHSHVVKTGFEVNMYVSTCLLHVYMCCGEVKDGLRFFEEIPIRNMVAWGSLISGLVSNNLFGDAIQAFRDMQRCDVEPNEMIMVDLLVASGRSKDIETGKWIHGLIVELGYDPFSQSAVDFNLILATSLMDMYGKCGDLRTARNLFDKMPQKNLVSWNSIIAVHSQNGDAEEALHMFSCMQVAGFKPDKATFLSLIRASIIQGHQKLGQSIHAYVSKTGIDRDAAVVSTLMDMHAKTGDAESAKRLFYDLEKKDAMAWTIMIIGLASHGFGYEALEIFSRMQEEGTAIPDEITYVGVLHACSHAGLVEEGQRHFVEMRDLYGIEPRIEHYGCMVDILSRAGQFEEAERLVQTMPVQANANIWGSLLNGCEIHEKVDLADQVRLQMSKSEELGSGIYVLLSNIYAKAGRWRDVKLARECMKRRKIAKVLAHSSVGTKF